MAPPSRRPHPSLTEALRAEPERFDFLQAVRLLERDAERAAADPRMAPVGRVGSDHEPAAEAVVLRAALELAFPTAEVAGLDDSGAKPELSVTLMGLHGPSGVLPGQYSQYVLEAQRDKNGALRDFFDLLNHRALSLFVRASDKYRLPLAYEQRGDRKVDPITAALLALVGLRPAALRDRQALSDETLAYHAGPFSHRRPTASTLAAMLSQYFDRPVRIRQFRGRWSELARDEQTRLGPVRRAGLGQFQQLGVDAVAGARVYDVQGSFRVELGPLDYAAFRGFMPDGALMAELVAFTRTYVGPTLGFDVRLTLKAQEIPPLELTSDPASAGRLGWNTWLPTRGPRGDPSDAVFATEEL
jgi:type VI secretion system protein ImpH